MKIDNIKIRFARKFPKLLYFFFSTTYNPIEVPIDAEAYRLFTGVYLKEGDSVLDVGVGMGFGLFEMMKKTKNLYGIDVDKKAVKIVKKKFDNYESIKFRHYNGRILPFDDNSFDFIISVDVIEHVKNYNKFLSELYRVCRKGFLISTPNRRPENTKPDGMPMNFWHLREWNKDELLQILAENGLKKIDWHFINGRNEGPFQTTNEPAGMSQTLTPFIYKV
ncbi:MAG: methyltransferase domain-containing protein [Ignavibacteria bacterium]|nr:methyltransferase domain-containing protein [Ignavibacteria bacterium]